MNTDSILDRAIRTLPCGASQDIGEGLKTVVISPPGKVESLKGLYVMDRQAADAIVAAFDRHGNEIPIDWDHATLATPTGRAPAGGWITRLWFDERGLMGMVRWNGDAQSAIRTGQYKYLSPVLLIRKSDGRAVELHSVGLTNKPAIPRMAALVASARLDADLIALASDDKSAMGLLRRIAAVLQLANVKTTEDVLSAALAKLEALLGGEDEGDDGTSSTAQNKELRSMAEHEDQETKSPDQLLTEIAGLLRDKGIEVSDEDRAAILMAVVELLRGDAPTEQASKALAVASRVREVLSLSADAGADEVVLAMTTRDTTGSATQLATMRQADREKWAQERVDHYVKVNVINPNNKDSLTAALSLAREDPNRFEALLSGARPYVPTGKTEPPIYSDAERVRVIASASREWRESKTLQGLSEHSAFVDQRLRDGSLSALEADEVKRLSA